MKVVASPLNEEVDIFEVAQSQVGHNSTPVVFAVLPKIKSCKTTSPVTRAARHHLALQAASNEGCHLPIQRGGEHF